MRTLHLALSVSVFAGAAFAGCFYGTDDAESAAGNLDRESARQLARKAVAAISGSSARCTSCHTAGREEILRWGTSMRQIEGQCLAAELSLSPAERVDCLREDPADPTSRYSAGRLGLYAGGAAQRQFEELFKQAHPDDWQDRLDAFRSEAAMPTSGVPGFTPTEFANVKRWVLAGMPELDAVLDEPGAGPCVQRVTPELFAHIDRMKIEGWGARHLAASTPMAGCGSATDPAQCFVSRPDLTPTWGAPGTAQTLRELRRLNFRTSFWTRSSPDGRFSGFGGSPARIIDLEAPDDARPVEVAAPYDPAFFPNNDGFSFAGTSAGGLRVCKHKVLLDALATGKKIQLDEPGCTKIISTVYQSIGAALDGSLYFMATGTHTNDSGNFTGPVPASFSENAKTTLTPMYNEGTRYVPGPAVEVTVPFEGDQQMSPSNTLLITRFGPRPGTAGYWIRSVTPRFGGAPDGGSSLEVTTSELATVCLAGGKPQLSFDERFLAVHQYTDANDNPDGLPAGTANIVVMDLKTGRTVQVTRVQAGQKALFPHFRADGWLYFLVRETGKETLVGSDVVLRLR